MMEKALLALGTDPHPVNAYATKVLRQNLSHILSTLFEISQDKYKNANTQIDTTSIFKKILGKKLLF